MVRKYQTVFLIEQIQPNWLPKSFQRMTYIICIWTFLGTIFGLFFGLILGLIQGTDYLITWGHWGDIIRGRLDTYEFNSWKDFLKITLLEQVTLRTIVHALNYAWHGAMFGILGAILAGITSHSKLRRKLTGILTLKSIKLLFAITGIGIALILSIISYSQLGFSIAFIIFFFWFDETIRFLPIQPVETMKWSWRKAKSNFFPIIKYSVLVSLFLGILIELVFHPIFGILTAAAFFNTDIQRIFSLLSGLMVVIIWGIVLMLAWLFIGLLAGFSIGLFVGLALGYERGPDVNIKVVPNQGIWKSLANVRKLVVTFSFFCLLVFGIMGSLIGWGEFRLIIALTSGFVGALIGVFFGGLMGGQGSGIVCIKHFILRVILGVSSIAPWNFAHFLDYATERIFMQKVGGGYIFVHRMLLEHFAEMELEQGQC